MFERIQDISLRFLAWLRIVDAHDWTVSLTSVALWVCVVKLALAPATGLADIGALLLALAAHQGKKLLFGRKRAQEEFEAAAQKAAEVRAESKVATVLQDVEQIKAKVSKLQTMAGFQ